MRREFSKAVKVSVIKDSTKSGVVFCKQCLLPAKKFQIDHIIPDSHGGEPIRSNAQLLCEICFGIKNPIDTKIAAKIKRQEARHIGAKVPEGKIHSAGFQKSAKALERAERASTRTMPPRVSLYEDE